MQSFEKLLHQNQQWSSAQKQHDPVFFDEVSKTQTSEFVWIGCSDSRVPAEIIVNAEPGEMCIHRNIAHQVIHTDFNCLSVLRYAVDALQVKHIIVRGPYNCGGIQAALNKQSSNSIITNKGLMFIKNSYRLPRHEIDSMRNENQRINKLVELIVIELVNSLAHASIIQKAWSDAQLPMLHGWVYGLHDDLITTLISLSPNKSNIHPIFQDEYADADCSHPSARNSTFNYYVDVRFEGELL